MAQSNLGFYFMTYMEKYNCHKGSLYDAVKALFVQINQLIVFIGGKKSVKEACIRNPLQPVQNKNERRECLKQELGLEEWHNLFIKWEKRSNL